jgi:hypothetical protein
VELDQRFAVSGKQRLQLRQQHVAHALLVQVDELERIQLARLFVAGQLHDGTAARTQLLHDFDVLKRHGALHLIVIGELHARLVYRDAVAFELF